MPDPHIVSGKHPTTMSALYPHVQSILSGSLQITLLILILAAVAAILDWLIQWMHERKFSRSLCTILHHATILIFAIECTLVISLAAAHAWDARPALFRAAATSTQTAS